MEIFLWSLAVVGTLLVIALVVASVVAFIDAAQSGVEDDWGLDEDDF